MRFAREAWPFVLPFAVLAGLLLGFGRPAWALGTLLVAVALLLFFRDPRRTTDGEPDAVLSAADGLITRIDRLEDPAVGPGAFHRIVTFLSVFDVHVQRTPVSGQVVASSHARGRKRAAFRADAGEVNEQHLTVIRRPNGERVGVRQIAGLLARRVVCYLDEEDTVERAQSMGLIKFGSRVDVLVPEGYRVTVSRGNRVKNGSTVIALPGERGEDAPVKDSGEDPRDP